jgi:hypothetical protein
VSTKNPTSKLRRIVVQFADMHHAPLQDPGNLLIDAFRAGHRIDSTKSIKVARRPNPVSLNKQNCTPYGVLNERAPYMMYNVQVQVQYSTVVSIGWVES